MKISARNQIQGTVKTILRGSVNAEVVVALAGGQELVSVVTLGSLDSLGLAVGKTVTVIVKASNVMLGVE